MSRMNKPKFLEGIKLPSSYYIAPNPYCDAPTNGVSLLALSRYARSKNKKIIDFSSEEVVNYSVKTEFHIIRLYVNS